MSTRPGSTLAAMALASLGPDEPDDPELAAAGVAGAVARVAGEPAAERRAVAEGAARRARVPRAAARRTRPRRLVLPEEVAERFGDPLVQAAWPMPTPAGEEGEGGDAGQHAVAHVVAVPAGRCAGCGGRRPHQRGTRVGRRTGEGLAGRAHRASGFRRGRPWRRCPGGRCHGSALGHTHRRRVGLLGQLAPAPGGWSPAGRWPGPWSRGPRSGRSRTPSCSSAGPPSGSVLVVLVFGHVRSSV